MLLYAGSSNIQVVIMSQGAAPTGNFSGQGTDFGKLIEPSIRTALPHYLPLCIFPLIFAALVFGGWWLVLPFLFFMTAGGVADRYFGVDGKNMDPARTSERSLFWHNVPVWSWALLWPLTLIFGMWQILVAHPFALWEGILLAIILTIEGQAVFIVGHELVHRRNNWERWLGEVLLASASYPQYATEHVYVHHAHVGTPHDVGSPPKGVSFWEYFPREVASNLTHSWKVVKMRMARRRLPLLHLSNPFWRYALYIAFWWGLAFWMGGPLAVLVFALLGLFCVFSMKISNYMQHYGLRRVRIEHGRWEKIMPRHSWSADWKFSNWLFFNMQRHADHHAMSTRQYPLLQYYNPEESPTLPGTYGELIRLVLQPRRWFEKLDPLVDQWRKHFYPEIEDWSAYDSRVAAARPDAFDTILEIFAVAPRLARHIEHHPELLDTLDAREFTDLDLPGGFGPDAAAETIARRGLTRLYWTREMGVEEMKSQIAEIPATGAKETAEVVRNWSNDRAFQIGMHVVRGNLLPGEARTALSNLAEAALETVLAAVVADFVDRRGALQNAGLAAVLLGDLASREVYPDVALDLLVVHDGLQAPDAEQFDKRFHKTLAELTRGSLLFSPPPQGSPAGLVLALDELAGYCRTSSYDALPDLSRARCVFESGTVHTADRFAKILDEVLDEWREDEALLARLLQSGKDIPKAGVSSYAQVRGGLEDIERCARYLRLTRTGKDDGVRAEDAQGVFRDAGIKTLAQSACLWRELQGILCLVGGEGFDINAASTKTRSLVASACGHEDLAALDAVVAETAALAAEETAALAVRD